MDLLAPYVPEDFDAFWSDAVSEANAVPLDFYRSGRNEFELAGFTVETLTFIGMNQQPLHGWFAYPPHAHRLPSFLWIPPYGRESLLPNAYGTRQGMVSMSLNLHGLDAFHQETYVPERGYFAEGAGSPETWVFRTMIQNTLVALRVLEAQGEADESRLGAMGMSQGAGLAIWLGVLSPKVKAVCADMPFLCGMRDTLGKQVYRYPLKELTDFMEEEPLGQARVMHTLGYFDTVNFATRCTAPTLVSYGTKDPSVRPPNARACFGALSTAEKKLVEYDWGHDWHPDMVPTNRDWLIAHL